MIPLHDDNPTSIKPYVTLALIASCTLVFLWQLSLGSGGARAIYGLGVIPAVLLDTKVLHPSLVLVPPVVTVFTSMFLHGGWMHLIGNMLYLWIFGNNVEDAMGHGRFVAFYLLCGIAAVFAQVLPDPASTTPMIGASGAISGVLGAYLLLYPPRPGFGGHSLRLLYSYHAPARRLGTGILVRDAIAERRAGRRSTGRGGLPRPPGRFYHRDGVDPVFQT